MQELSQTLNISDSNLELDLVREAIVHVYYSLFVKKDLEESLKNIRKDVKWNGTEDFFVAENLLQLKELFRKRIETIPSDTELKVIRTDVISLGTSGYSVSGEMELRMPHKEDIHYVALRFMNSLVIENSKPVICSGQTFITEQTEVKKEVVVKEKAYQHPEDTEHPEQYDHLTGLYTLDYFKDTAKLYLQHVKQGKMYALLYTDITNFEKLNNLYGMQKADKVLTELAGLLMNFDKRVIYCCRSVADHFLLLMEIDDRDVVYKVATALCRRFDETIKGEFPDAILKLGIGIYVIEDLKIGIDKMVEHANVARKSLRFPSSTRVAFYDIRAFKHVEKIKKIEKGMQDALNQGEFKVYIQPKFNMITGEITGAEALVRWIRPDGTMVYPDEFIPVFEKNGFIEKIDFYMLEEICKMIAKRRKAKKKCIPISINQSRVLLNKKDYTTHIAKILLKYQTPPQLIELELTERLFSDRYGDMFVMMEQLKKVGIRWSIDDFGTGYSSLNLLKELPVDIVKLDKSFLNEAETSEISRIIIRKIVELTKELQKSIVCEGVETKAQADYLKSIHCDMAQGFLYARPMPMEDFEHLLDHKNTKPAIK